MEFIYKKRFLKRFEHASLLEQDLIRETDKQIRTYYQTHKASYGLRIKQLYRGPGGKVYEARVSESLRLLWAEKRSQIAFILIGSHNDVRNFLRSL